MVKRSLQDVIADRDANAYGDHHLIATTIKLKLKKPSQKATGRRNWTLPNEDFVLELRNRFNTPESSSEMEEEPTMNSKWNTIKTIYSETAQKVLGFKQKGAKEWTSAYTWQKAEEREQLKANMLDTKSQRLLGKTRMSYKNKDRAVKRGARRDKRVLLNTWQVKPRKLQPMETFTQCTNSQCHYVANVQTKLRMYGIKWQHLYIRE